MKATELRIGNLVYRSGFLYEERNKFSERTVDHNSITACFISPESFKPIPLTEERLVKFGFVFINKMNIYGWYLEVGNRMLCWCHSPEINLEFKEGQCDEYQNTLYDFNCEYVHQLQNLYFTLTGEELTLQP